MYHIFGRLFSKKPLDAMQQLFYQSCCIGDTNKIKELLTPPVMEALEPPNTNPDLIYSVLLYNYGIQIACKNHHTTVIRLLLEYKPMHRYVDFTMSNHFALRTVCREGYDDIVRLILHHHPFQNVTHCIYLAKQNGHTEVVRILETPVYYALFCDELYLHDKVETGLQLLCYQDMLLEKERKKVIDFMTEYLLHIFQLPKDIIRYICMF